MDLSLPFYLSYAALWILVSLQSLILMGLVRMVYQLQRNSVAVGLSEGQEAPQFSALSLSGAPVNSKDFAGRMTALLFVSPTCASCAETLADISYMRYKANQGNVLVICRSGRADCYGLVEKYELNVPTIADEDDQISRLYSISSVPTAVIINENNRIKSYGQPKRDEKLNEVFLKEEEAQLQGGQLA